jgi:hypothetical protein
MEFQKSLIAVYDETIIVDQSTQFPLGHLTAAVVSHQDVERIVGQINELLLKSYANDPRNMFICMVVLVNVVFSALMIVIGITVHFVEQHRWIFYIFGAVFFSVNFCFWSCAPAVGEQRTKEFCDNVKLLSRTHDHKGILIDLHIFEFSEPRVFQGYNRSRESLRLVISVFKPVLRQFEGEAKNDVVQIAPPVYSESSSLLASSSFQGNYESA